MDVNAHARPALPDTVPAAAVGGARALSRAGPGGWGAPGLPGGTGKGRAAARERRPTGEVDTRAAAGSAAAGTDVELIVERLVVSGIGVRDRERLRAAAQSELERLLAGVAGSGESPPRIGELVDWNAKGAASAARAGPRAIPSPEVERVVLQAGSMSDAGLGGELGRAVFRALGRRGSGA